MFKNQDGPSTKVHAAPGGGSSLGYLFGDGSKWHHEFKKGCMMSI